MSGSASLPLEQQLLEHSLGIAPMPPTMQAYVALCLVSPPPSETTAGFEVSGNSYARVAAPFDLLATPANAAANSAAVEFPIAAASWGTVGWFEVWDAPAGGNRLYWGELVDPSDNTTPLTLSVSAGDIVRFSVGTLTIVAATAPTVIAVGGVTSFNTRTGSVILSNSDVVTVLPPSTNPPLMDGVAAAGSSASWARGDHVHPTDAAATHNVGRNLLHNPLFNVAQRGAGPWSVTGYTLDRWVLATSLDTALVQQDALTDGARAAIGDEAARFALHIQTTGNAGAAAYTEAAHYVEGVARLSNKTVTLSFWATASVANMKFGIGAAQVFGTGGSPSAAVVIPMQVVTLTTAWARYSVTFSVPSMAGKTLGTNNNDYTMFQFVISSGTTNFPLVGVQTGTIQMWGVQLEVGSVATPLEKPDPQQNLAKCQRFYQVLSPVTLVCPVATSLNGFTANIIFPVTMRAVPALAATHVAGSVTRGAVFAYQSLSGTTVYMAGTGVAGDYEVHNVTASADL